MLKIVIVEDESLAARKLASLVKKYDPSIEILAQLASIQEAVSWFSQNTSPDLVFMDIHLEDGLSFSIFEMIDIKVPIIFTTAFDEFTINAFKVNSIDYLLKPLNYEDLSKSIDKFKSFSKLFSAKSNDIKYLIESMLPKEDIYKRRFLINEANHLIVVETQEIAYFFSEGKYTYMLTTHGKQLLIDFTLDKLSSILDPKAFYRVNRQFIISIDSIGRMIKYGTNKLRINLIPPTHKEVFVSMEKYTSFKNWLDG